MGCERLCEWRTSYDRDSDEEYDYQASETSDENAASRKRRAGVEARATEEVRHLRNAVRVRPWEGNPIGLNAGGKALSVFIDLTGED